MDSGSIRLRGQALARIAVRKQLCDLRQYLEMLLGRLLRHEQKDQQTDGLSVRRLERNRLSQAHKGRKRMLEAFDPSVRNGDAFTQPRRTEPFPCEQVIGDDAACDPVLILKNETSLFEHALFAGNGKPENDVFER